jgi:PKD repeat protein
MIRSSPFSRAVRIALPAALACLFAPAAADAATFCVASPSNCGGGTTQTSLQNALNAAQANGSSKDTIRVGIGLFNDAPYVDAPGNPVTIIGEGIGKTAFSAPTNSGATILLDVQEPTSELHDLRVHVDNAAATTGIKLAGASADHVLVSNMLTDGLDGFQLTGSAAVGDSSSDLVCPANIQCRGVFVVAGASPTVRDSYLSATVGASAAGDLTLRRTRIQATQGVVASGGAQATVNDTMIKLPGPAPSNFQIAGLAAAGDGVTHIDADRVTVAGDGTGFGVWVVPNATPGANASVDIQGSVISNVSSDLHETHSAPATGSITASWTAFRFASKSGTFVNGGNNLDVTGVNTKLVDAGGQVMAPAHDSPLVDRGDPGFLSLMGTDVLGNLRVRDGDAAGGARVDLGADEYQRAAPVANAAPASPAAALTNETITFSDTASDDPDPGETLTYVWTFDDGQPVTGTSAQHAFATAGQHTATLTVTDPTGLSDQAVVTVTVTDPPPQPGPGPGPDPGPGPGPGPGPKNIAPKLTGVRLSPKSFRPRKGKKGGTGVVFTLSETATIAFTVEKPAKGRKAGGKCVKQTSKNRKAKGCTRWVKVGSFSAKAGAGKKTLAWGGKLAGKKVAPGGYRITARATDAGGLKSALLTARFVVKR